MTPVATLPKGEKCRQSDWRLYQKYWDSLGGNWNPTYVLPKSGLLPDHWYRSDIGLWQDAGMTPVANDGDVVGRWEDLTANADHMNQAAAGNKPTFQSGVGDLLNGHPVIRFDGTDDAIEGAFTNGGLISQPTTIFFVVKLNVAAVNDDVYRYIFDGDDAVNRNSVYTDAAAVPDKWAATAGVALSSLVNDSSAWIIFTILYNGASSRIWLRGALANSGNTGAGGLDGFCIGNRAAAAGAGRPWWGDDAEFLIYNANLNNADKNTVGNYLATRYALAYTDI